MEKQEGMIYETKLGAKYYFDKKGRNIKIEDRGGKYLELTYDEVGRLDSVKSVSGETLFYRYNEENLLIKMTWKCEGVLTFPRMKTYGTHFTVAQ